MMSMRSRPDRPRRLRQRGFPNLAVAASWFVTRADRARLRLTLAPLAATLLMSLSWGAQAQDAEHGRVLARQWCASCHLVETGTPASDAAPPFATIAKDPASTPERLHGWLAAPHPPMPDLKLSREDEDDLVAYLLSLKAH